MLEQNHLQIFKTFHRLIQVKKSRLCSKPATRQQPHKKEACRDCVMSLMKIFEADIFMQSKRIKVTTLFLLHDEGTAL